MGKRGPKPKANGKRKMAAYPVWAQMIQRCRNPRSHAWKNYGGRGITVCDKWLKFDGFLEDMGDRPQRLTIERKDNDKGYCKENCRWATQYEQAANKRGLRLLTHDGKTQSVRRWATEKGMTYLTLYQRLFKHKWSVTRSLTEPVDTNRRNRHARGRRG